MTEQIGVASALQAHHESRVYILQLLSAEEIEFEIASVFRLNFQFGRASRDRDHLNTRKRHRVSLIVFRSAAVVAILDEAYAVIRHNKPANRVRLLGHVVADALLLALDQKG